MKIRLSELRRVIREEVANNDPQAIIDNTDPTYIEKTLATRNPSGAIQAGSVFLSPQTVESLKAADWEPFNHPAIQSPAIAFTAPIPGRLGVVPSSELPGTLPVRFQLSHGGKGGKSGTAAEVVAAFDASLGEVDSTTLIAGPDRQDPQKYVVWTFHPGDPSPQADEISIDSIKEEFPDLRATVADARRLGFNFIKRVDRLSESNYRLRSYIRSIVSEHLTLTKR